MRIRLSRRVHQAMGRVQAGQGLAEYGLIITVVSIAAVLIMSLMGTSVNSLYSHASAVFPR
jgi:pilus assembly protein Flp/PilA